MQMIIFKKRFFKSFIFGKTNGASANKHAALVKGPEVGTLVS